MHNHGKGHYIVIKITPHPDWVKSLLDFIEPYKDKVVNNRIFKDINCTRLTAEQFQGAFVNFYPLIESFPKYMALSLAKVPAGNSKWSRKTRYWLITNMNQERLHTEWWKKMARDFGVPKEVLQKEVYPLPEIDAINNYLWRICTHGSLAEGISAANFAVEGATGEWTKKTKPGFEKYRKMKGFDLDERSLEWVTAHASYDDRHPDEALEIIKAYASTKEEQEKIKQAAKRSFEYYALALDTCYQTFK
jgi:pyrroloquinoline quinone (PQQ) biosynthesis protein C